MHLSFREFAPYGINSRGVRARFRQHRTFFGAQVDDGELVVTEKIWLSPVIKPRDADR
jgi:hypothetical protein